MNLRGLWSRQDDCKEQEIRALKDELAQATQVINDLSAISNGLSVEIGTLKGERDSLIVGLQKLKRRCKLLIIIAVLFALLSMSFVFYYEDLINKFVLSWEFLEPLFFLLNLLFIVFHFLYRHFWR